MERARPGWESKEGWEISGESGEGIWELKKKAKSGEGWRTGDIYTLG
jgi:hypothetical protein